MPNHRCRPACVTRRTCPTAEQICGDRRDDHEYRALDSRIEKNWQSRLKRRMTGNEFGEHLTSLLLGVIDQARDPLELCASQFWPLELQERRDRLFRRIAEECFQ